LHKTQKHRFRAWQHDCNKKTQLSLTNPRDASARFILKKRGFYYVIRS